jgi:hypothetical protein
MAAVVGRCYTAATRSIAAMSVVGRHADHFDANCRHGDRWGLFPLVVGRWRVLRVVLVSVVAVLRCCTAKERTLTGTSRARAARTRCRTWFHAG